MDSNDPYQVRFFAGGGVALCCIRAALEQAEIIRIATAYFEPSGYQLLQDILAGRRLSLLIGREEGGVDKAKEVLDDFYNQLSMGDFERRTRAMRQMLDALENKLMMIAVGEGGLEEVAYMDARYLYQHAKLYIADQRIVVVTSANFSGHGLKRSREAGYSVTIPEDVAYFVDRFDHYFAQAQSITQELIKIIRGYLKAQDPFAVYARTLLELYGLPTDEAPKQLPPLAKYQEAVASSVLSSLLQYEGAFLVASTGLGKTIIAAHVVAYLRMQDEIDNVLVVCPAGLREMWRRTLYAARTTSIEFSYHTLSETDQARDSQLAILESTLRNISSQTCLILDESHHLRNEEGNGNELRLRNERIRRAVHQSKAKVLLMTATPFSREIDDVNSQLRLLPTRKFSEGTALGFQIGANQVKIDDLKQLSELPLATVLTTPDVVHHFGKFDEAGERYIEFAQGEKRYFPRLLKLRTISFDNPLDTLLADLLKGDLLYKKRRSKDSSSQMNLFDLEGMEGRGIRDPLMESQYLHQFCSSPARIKILCGKLAKGEFSFELANQAELTQFLRDHHSDIRKYTQPRYDTKLKKLVDLINLHAEEKIVVFCYYIETAKRLKEGLAKLLPKVRVETTAEQSGEALDKMLQSFAPIAHEVPEDQRLPTDVRVLIATGALAEGFNLQDASVLVNYDLPWTVLELAQRMGRVLRPWHAPREILIYNFIPSTMSRLDLPHALNWHKRLGARSEQHRSFSNIPVFLRQHTGEESYEMERLASELLQYHTEEDLNLDQVLEFIQNTRDFTTSSFYNDLASIPDQKAILDLPSGFRSARIVKGKKRLYLLFKTGKRAVHAALFDQRGRPLPECEHRERVLQVIRCTPEEPRAPLLMYPEDDEFDAWINRSLENWKSEHPAENSAIQLICALALMPQPD